MAGRGESGDMAEKSEEVSADISGTAEGIIRDSPPNPMKLMVLLYQRLRTQPGYHRAF